MNASLFVEWEVIGLAREVITAANLFHSPAYLQQSQAPDDGDHDGLPDDHHARRRVQLRR